jgi:polyribonucleotide nucleotidyltransferase
MSCATSIYRYLNEDKIAIYNDNRNIRDMLKYNLDEEYREKMREKGRNKYYKKVQKLEEETIKEFEELVKDNEEGIDAYINYLSNKTIDKKLYNKKIKIVDNYLYIQNLK